MRDPKELAAIADRLEAECCADMFGAAPHALKAALGLDVRRMHGVTVLIASRIPEPTFNRVIGLGVTQPAERAVVQAVAAAFQQAGVRRWWLHWHPCARPVEFPEQLAAMGFVLASRRTWAAFHRDPSPLPAPSSDLRIALARESELDAVMAAIAKGFGMPPVMSQWLGALYGRPRWKVYAVLDGKLPVGGGCLYVDGEFARLGIAAILESHRGRGGQRALMARRITDAAAGGCRHLFTETGEPIGDEPNPSYANMIRCGFQKIASRLNFAAPSP